MSLGLGREGFLAGDGWRPVRIHAAVVVLALLAGCSGPASDPTAVDQSPTTTGPARAPPGWSKDACDTRPTAFSANAQVPPLFQRQGNASADAFARRIVEAAGDELGEPYEDTSSEVMKDPHNWRTRDGTITVYWHLDPGAWRALYVATKVAPAIADDAEGRTAVAHAVLGALGVSTEGIVWAAGSGTLQATREVGGAPLALVSVADVTMQAEQSEVLRRSIDVNPAYDTPSGLLGAPEAGRIAQAALDCKATRGEAGAFSVNSSMVQVLGFEGNLAYWFFVEPQAGWSEGGRGRCGYADAGRLHLGLDAVSGTVLSSDLLCGR